MLSGSAKRVVVLKNIQSNLIEEAILILKTEPVKTEDAKNNKDKLQKGGKANNDFLIKEAELIINNFVKENRLQIEKDRQRGKKPISSKNKAFTNTAINLGLIGSIILLAYIIFRLI